VEKGCSAVKTLRLALHFKLIALHDFPWAPVARLRILRRSSLTLVLLPREDELVSAYQVTVGSAAASVLVELNSTLHKREPFPLTQAGPLSALCRYLPVVKDG